MRMSSLWENNKSGTVLKLYDGENDTKRYLRDEIYTKKEFL